MELWIQGVARLTCVGVAAAALLAAGAPSAAAQAANDSAGRAANDPFVTGVYHPENYARGSAPGTSGGTDNRSSITGVYHPDPPPAPPADSARAGKADSTGNDERGTSAVVSLPVDLPVALACGDAPLGSSAADLLSVVFLQGTTDAQRAAIVKQAGGVLAGRSAFGDDYVRVPESAGPTSLVADRLIRLPRVTQVEPVACPGAARAKAAVRAARAAAPCDSTAPPSKSGAAAKPSRQ